MCFIFVRLHLLDTKLKENNLQHELHDRHHHFRSVITYDAFERYVNEYLSIYQLPLGILHGSAIHEHHHHLVLLYTYPGKSKDFQEIRHICDNHQKDHQ